MAQKGRSRCRECGAPATCNFGNKSMCGDCYEELLFQMSPTVITRSICDDPDRFGDESTPWQDNAVRAMEDSGV